MHISRIQVEDGFLNGLDLRLSSGLNVVIGARGTGKTSLIELIRFATGARNHTTEAQQQSLEHAQAILEDGEITVTLEDGLDEIVASRSSTDDEPRKSADFVPPIIFSQKEIETLGLSESGRLSLLDAFVRGRTALRSEEATAVSAIKSIYREIQDLESELVSLSAGLDVLPGLQAQKAQLQQQQAAFQSGSEAIAQKQSELKKLTDQLSTNAVQDSIIGRFLANTERMEADLRRLIAGDPGLEAWDGLANQDPLAGVREEYKKTMVSISQAADTLAKLRGAATKQRTACSGTRVELDRSSRTLRAEINKVAEGAGAVARQLTSVDAQLAQLVARQKVVAERNQRLKQLRKKRDESISTLEKVRERRSAMRTTAASQISSALAPHIRIDVEQAGQYGQYVGALTESLRGSGMKYNDLAKSLAENVSPRELIEFVEENNFTALAEIAAIPKDRAARLIGHLRETGVSDIATCLIDDNVRMSLLDGVDYKDVAALSAGQRCTVILSVVLQQRDRILIIDQPEDHLDNAFIATTVIKALRERKGSGQVILSTHNANIPVLGNADLVIEFTSDGRNGFVQVAEKLDHPDAVNAITTVMEGGLSAFQARAKFYEKYDL